MSSAKVYWTNPLEYQFTVKIIDCICVEDNFHISIDKEVIRPEGGGQAGDRGILQRNGVEKNIFNTIKSNGKVWLVSESSVEVGDTYNLIVDQEWRRNMMRNHTSEHLFVSELKRLNDAVKLGYIWIDGEKGTVELSGDEITIELLITAERKVQEIILENKPVETRFVSAKKLPANVRAREGVEEQHDILRIVSIEGIDESACSGLHVMNTGDIGTFKILDYKIDESGTRVEFSTHAQALKQMSFVFNEVLTRKQEYPFEIQQIGAVLDKAKRNSDAKEELIPEIVKLIESGPTISNVAGISFRHTKLPGYSSRELRYILQSLHHPSQSAILLFSPGQKSNFILQINGLEKSSADLIATTVEELGGKGGGSKETYTGGFNDVSDPDSLYESLVQSVVRNLQA
ncbi:MAG: hypothetical protein ACFFF4_15545 [Candidatus Thorarchaeota archaeon]